jgi:uncharacterized protein
VIKLTLLPELYALCKLPPEQDVPAAVLASPICIVARSTPASGTIAELSVLCQQDIAPQQWETDRDWKLFAYVSSIEGGETGTVAKITGALAAQEISVIVFTTYDAGYFGVQAAVADRAVAALRTAGCVVHVPPAP